MKIALTFGEPHRMDDFSVTTIRLHTASSGRYCGEFEMIQHATGETHYRTTDDEFRFQPGLTVDEITGFVRRRHFRQTYQQLRAEFHATDVAAA